MKRGAIFRVPYNCLDSLSGEHPVLIVMLKRLDAALLQAHVNKSAWKS